MNQFFLEINTCTIAPWQLILGLLLPFLLGYLFKRFLDEQYVKGFKSLTAENSSLKDEVSKSLSYKSSLSVAEKEQKNLKAGLLERSWLRGILPSRELRSTG